MAFGVVALLDRYSVRHDLQGPRLRFGFLWFAVLLLSLLGGTLGVAVLFSLVGSVTALQVGGAWRAKHSPVNQVLAAVVAGLAPFASYGSNRWSGLLLLAFAVLALVLGTAAGVDPRKVTKDSIVGNWKAAGATLRSGFFVALVGIAVVQIHRVDSLMLLFLLAAACVYDSGDYLCGAGYRNRIVGPVAGSFGVLVVTMSMTAIRLDPLSGAQVWFFGVAFAVLCPLGQLFGSWILPSARTSVPGLRRLDAWLLSAPFFWIGLSLVRH